MLATAPEEYIGISAALGRPSMALLPCWLYSHFCLKVFLRFRALEMERRNHNTPEANHQ